MKNLSKSEVIKILTKAAKDYETNLLNRDFLIAYQERQTIKFSCVRFLKHNFKHLTGVSSNLPANVFYNKCIDNKLSPDDFQIDSRGKVAQKMEVLPHLGNVLYKNCMIGPFLNSGIQISADYFVGDTRVYISIGIRNDLKGNPDFPVSLYSEDIRKLTSPSCRVIAIFSKFTNVKEYTTCTFLANGITLASLKIPSDYIVNCNQ